jgi:hypothetical protein
MRYRQLTTSGDYVAAQPFLIDTPQTVAQAILTRLKLWQGEWFLDITDGTPYLQSILGKPYALNPDVYIKQRILTTPEVTSILSYTSNFDGGTRAYTFSATVATAYGTATVSGTL